jgi:hypothetical protein
MSSISLISKINPLASTEHLLGKRRTADQLVETIIETAIALWPRKTAANLSSRAQVSQRTAEFWLAKERGLSLEAAQNLLQSKEGFHFLEGIMGDSQAPWWIELKRSKANADLSRSLDLMAEKVAALRAECNVSNRC